jgi:hypothetical protein
MADIEKARAGEMGVQPGAEPSIGSGDDREDGTNSLKERDVATEAASELARLTPEEYREMEKKLVWRIDKKLIPWMT